MKGQQHDRGSSDRLGGWLPVHLVAAPRGAVMGCVVLGAPDSATMQLEPVVVGFRDIDEWVATETRGAFRPAVTRWTRHQWKEPVVRWKVAHTWRVGDDVMGGWHWDGCR